MTDYIDPHFTPAGLSTYQGYHLQVFCSGRAKLSLQTEGRQKLDYYADRPKRDREAYRRQRVRSGEALHDHFARVDALLAQWERSYVYRVHVKGNNNKTADNAHIVVSQYASSIWVVFDAVLHEWEVPGVVVRTLISGQGPRTGQASLFHEYMPSYEHDWQSASFAGDLYTKGLRKQVLDTLCDEDTTTLLSASTLPQRAAIPPRPVMPDHQVCPDGSFDHNPAEEDPVLFGPEPEDWEAVEAEDPFAPIIPPKKPRQECLSASST